jgi:hypothetical protein
MKTSMFLPKTSMISPDRVRLDVISAKAMAKQTLKPIQRIQIIQQKSESALELRSFHPRPTIIAEIILIHEIIRFV